MKRGEPRSPGRQGQTNSRQQAETGAAGTSLPLLSVETPRVTSPQLRGAEGDSRDGAGGPQPQEPSAPGFPELARLLLAASGTTPVEERDTHLSSSQALMLAPSCGSFTAFDSRKAFSNLGTGYAEALGRGRGLFRAAL